MVATDVTRTIIKAMQESTGNVRQQREGQEFESGPYEICRADLAAFLLDIVENSDDSKSIINVTWGKNK
jgi:hypothetical protein